MARIGAVLIHFDGTACPQDVTEELLKAFAGPGWEAYDEAVGRGEIGLLECVTLQAGMVSATREEMLAYALARFRVDPTLRPFVAWAEGRALALAVVSDGFGFYVRPMLEAAGLGRLEVLTNEPVFHGHGLSLRAPPRPPRVPRLWDLQDAGRPRVPGAPRLGGVRRRGAVRPLRRALLRPRVRQGCPGPDLRADGVPHRTWETFDDVRRALEALAELPGPIAPETCPGWQTD